MAAQKALAVYLSEIKDLPPEEQLQLLVLITQGLQRDTTIKRKKKHSILELEGLGAELWQGIDAQEYVNEMRDEWDRQS